MVTTANTQYDSELTLIGTIWGLSNNAVFDRLVLQASQRLGGGSTSTQSANSTNAAGGAQVGANGSVFSTAGNATGTRGGWGSD